MHPPLLSDGKTILISGAGGNFGREGSLYFAAAVREDAGAGCCHMAVVAVDTATCSFALRAAGRQYHRR
eukprot:5400159-Pleurochrysis_carterae.AAC.1